MAQLSQTIYGVEGCGIDRKRKELKSKESSAQFRYVYDKQRQVFPRFLFFFAIAN